jgi:hypothetical protein
VYGYGELNSIAVLRSISPIEISLPAVKNYLYIGKPVIATKIIRFIIQATLTQEMVKYPAADNY